LERENEHVIRIELKYPIYRDNETIHDFLLNGTDLTDSEDFETMTLEERYEIEEDKEYNKNHNKKETIKFSEYIATLPLMRH